MARNGSRQVAAPEPASGAVDDVGTGGVPTKDRHDFLWKTLGRIDGYIGTTNAKAALLVALNTFMLGGFILKSGDILTPLKPHQTLHGIACGLIITIGILSTLNLCLTISAVQPVLTSNKRPGDYHSRIFFGDIAEFENARTYLNQVEKVDARDSLADLAQQVHVVSRIAMKKFNRLQLVSRLTVFVQVPILCVLLALSLIVSF